MRPERPRPRRTRESSSGTTVSSGNIDYAQYDTNTDTQGNKWYGSMGQPGVSAKMMRHPHIRQSVGYVTNPLRAATWRFKEASSSPLDREVADFCTWCLCEQLPWDMVLERMVRGYVQDGFALSEMTDDMRPIPQSRFPNHPGGGRGLVPTGLHEIPANTVDKWYQDKANPTQLRSIKQWQPYSETETSGWREISADRIIRFAYAQSGANFAGEAVLRSCYGPYKALNSMETYRLIGFERTAVGTPVATAAEDADEEELDSIELLLENMRTMAKGAMVLPHGYTLKWEGAGESDIDNLNTAIEFVKTDIAVNVSAGFTRLGQTGPGSYALGVTLANPYHLSIAGHSKLVSTGFTLGLDGWSFARRVVALNYGAAVPVPILEARNLPTRDYATILPLLYNAVANKIITPDAPLESEVRDALQFGPHDESTARSGNGAPGVQIAPPPPPPPEEPEDE
jgi:hypothetical protein